MSDEENGRIKHASLHDAMVAIAKDLMVGIGKSRTNTHQNYQFRSVDDVLNAVGPALARHGVIAIPKFTEMTRSENGKMTRIFLHGFVNYAGYGSEYIAETWGEGLDSSDKATAKAMSFAMKYAHIYTFNIPVVGTDDGDFSSPETSGRGAPQQISVDDVCQQLDAAQDLKAFQAAWKDAAAKFTEAKDTFGYNAAKEYMLQTYEARGWSA